MFILHWSYIFLFLSLSIAVYTDITKYKIYNVLTFPTIFLGCLFSFVNGVGILDSLGGFSVAFIIGLVFFATKGLKGGDVKLICAVGAWVGLQFVVNTILYILICGGILSIFYSIIGGTFIETSKKVGRFFSALITPGMNARSEIETSINKPVPYGIAIFLGTLISFLLR